jgi:hypothetical protein
MGLIDKLLSNIDGRGNEAADAFNLYQKWFDTLDKTDKSIDTDLHGVRVRCFGNPEEKQKAWEKDWKSKYPEWGDVPAGISVSSEKPEVWCDLRQDKHGNIIMPMHVIGHEVTHILKLKNKEIADPDTLIKNDIYR